MAKIFATTSPEISVRERENMNRSRKIASQGMVLLKNDGALPFEEGTKKVALYGNGARHTVKGGTGSGDVNSRFVINIEQGLEEAGLEVTTKGWINRYERLVEEKEEAYFAGLRERLAKQGEDAVLLLFTQPFREPPVIPVTEEDIHNSDTDTAVYVISRNSGEGKDRAPVPGDYELYEEEKEAIACVAKHYEKTIVVLNVGGVMDTKFLRATEGINAVLLMSQAGNIGGYALADVLTGKVTPSGRLTTTWAENYGDYPSAETFSHMNGDIHDEYYNEGIYVGYRYFDTFNIAPAYPFGYGGSYTVFETEVQKVCADADRVSVTVKVTNTGKEHTGREVVQIYYSAPEGRLEKPYQELAAYGKTKELTPGESQVMSISYPLAEMASYDPQQACWLLEAGVYYIRVGSSSRSTRVAAAVSLDVDAVTQILSNRLQPDCELKECSARGIVAYSYEGEEAEKEAAVKLSLRAADVVCRKAEYRKENPQLPAPACDRVITLQDVAEKRATLDELVAQLDVAEMADLCVGTARGGLGGDSIVGAASAACPGAAGDTTSALLEKRGVMNMILADGPAGLRLSTSFVTDKDNNLIPGSGMAALPGMDRLGLAVHKPELPGDAITYYQYCTAIPIATLLAQTWDVEAIMEAGDIVGGEMEELGVTLWLAPGMNIHRNPLCGRNFEYYSEDPLVAGMCAAADTLGVQRHPGVGTTIKHFAFNNQEDNRMHVNSHISERAAREIYLKGFEIAVRASQPMSIMTSYNLVNGIHTANSQELLTAIARDEWGFAGLVMTDWGTTGSIEMEPGSAFKYGCSSAAGCIRAGNDLIMPGSQNDVDEITQSVGAAEGTVACPITTGDLQACARRILSIVIQSSACPEAAPYAADKCGLEGYVKAE